ncbi:trypsin-like peptidase domain-containing protein [Lysobacter enzymogenes]|uniref:trypsin-like peptidase domain-containing protein n=1 Tax=Lysobacter enzymogenes TaxID=69 RepID=UPI001A978962|nr:trypsin-like peptidase domain-containing protein [Lysobacter enzymogenes]QQP98732.1 trypsin-like peptidase domain-containing protein [Lysobacter enzymogenes]
MFFVSRTISKYLGAKPVSKFSHPLSKLVHGTVRIECIGRDGSVSSGTGYVYGFCESEKGCRPGVVTNKHVVRGAARVIFHLTLRKEDGSADLGSHEAVAVDNVAQCCVYHPDPGIDLVAFPIGSILNDGVSGRQFFFTMIGKDTVAADDLLESLSPMEEIVMIGYPNGLWDEFHNLPIVRKGITATHPRLRLNGKPEFLIDAACFPGSSGSPVFLANIGTYLDSNGLLHAATRIALLGTLYSGPQYTAAGDVRVVDVPTDTRVVSFSSIPSNLGYVIQARELFVLDEAIAKAQEEGGNGRLPSRNSDCPCHSGLKYKECCGVI